MEAEIIEEKQNPLLDRKEVKVTVESTSSPSKVDALKLIAEKFSTPEENVKLEKVASRFGSTKFTILAKIYSSKEAMNRVEPKLKEKKTKQ